MRRKEKVVTMPSYEELVVERDRQLAELQNWEQQQMPRKKNLDENPRSKRTDYQRKTYGSRLGARLRELRERRGLRVSDLGDVLRGDGLTISDPAIYAWERGAENGGDDMPVRYLPAVAAALGVKIHTLLPPE